jgi:small-conductance mechanosensitive channel/CRP-like cAMP-binding protein
MDQTAIRVALGVGLLLFTGVVRGASRNRLVRRKLVMTLVLLLAYVAVGLALGWYHPAEEVAARAISINQLVIALALINLLVVVAINPLREDRVPERFPTIVQDAIIIAAFMIVATFVMQEKFLTTSAVGAVVVGFALQDTLGNMFSGLAIQVEKPFRVGHWVGVGPFEGMVTEVSWRATKLRTKSGNNVILPNALISREAIINYSQPAAPTRLEVVVGVSYDVPPTQVKAALREALRNAPMALASPAPEVVVDDFASSSVAYRVRFWIDDFSRDTLARDEVRSAIYYSLKRHRYEIPFPIQVHVDRGEAQERVTNRLARYDATLRPVELFQPLTDAERRELAARGTERLFGPGDAIVRQDDEGRSMFVICSGRVKVVEASGREIAVLGPGNYIGEMSMLTGQPRSATVLAVSECATLELTSDALREVALDNPDVLERISTVVTERRADLERQKAEAARAKGDVSESSRSLLTRIRSFLGLPDLSRS